VFGNRTQEVHLPVLLAAKLPIPVETAKLTSGHGDAHLCSPFHSSASTQ
jgi:hypothetical protein